MLNALPVSSSPHQIGIQEMLFISEMRRGAPTGSGLLGVIPETLDPGDTLSNVLQERVGEVGRLLVRTAGMGHAVREKSALVTDALTCQRRYIMFGFGCLN